MASRRSVEEKLKQREQPRRLRAACTVRATPGDGGSRRNEAIVEEARRNGLLEGEKSVHVSFRVAPALVEAAKRETGISSTSELGTLALAMLAQPDPVAAVMKRTRGRLGKDHALDT